MFILIYMLESKILPEIIPAYIIDDLKRREEMERIKWEEGRRIYIDQDDGYIPRKESNDEVEEGPIIIPLFTNSYFKQ